MKTLIIVTHPHIEDSLINKRWIEELEKYPEQYTIHQLYKVYPDEHIDVKKEQQLIEQYDHIVFHFSRIARFTNEVEHPRKTFSLSMATGVPLLKTRNIRRLLRCI